VVRSGRTVADTEETTSAIPKVHAIRLLKKMLNAYLSGMRKSQFEPCIPTGSTKVRAGKDWLHEIKHDGYRLIVQKDHKTVRLFSRNGHDLTTPYPWIAEAALENRQSRFVIDGEAVNRSTLYGEAACNVIGLAFDPCPFDCLVVVATPERHFFAAEGDDNLALGDIVVTSYPHFGGMFGDH
jgi:hypothetical protein